MICIHVYQCMECNYSVVYGSALHADQHNGLSSNNFNFFLAFLPLTFQSDHRWCQAGNQNKMEDRLILCISTGSIPRVWQNNLIKFLHKTFECIV